MPLTGIFCKGSALTKVFYQTDKQSRWAPIQWISLFVCYSHFSQKSSHASKSTRSSYSLTQRNDL